jgi:serine/threonine protein kinase
VIDPELATFHAVIIKAHTCEDVFGALADPKADAGKTLYRKFARIVHEDRHVGDPEAVKLAHEAMSLLSKFWNEAQEKIDRGLYGKKAVFEIKSQKHRYSVDETIAEGELSTVYGAGQHRPPLGPERVVLKVAKSPAVNDLLENEARVVADLVQGITTQSAVYQRLLPRLQESFGVKSKSVVRRVNVFGDERREPLYTLEDIMRVYPGGIDARHFVWMFKRLLGVLGYAHGRGWVHGAVLPCHVLVRPKDHGILMVDWCYAVEAGKPMKAVSPTYRQFYPEEVGRKMPVSPATDVYMAARCMESVVGRFKQVLPVRFLTILDSCTIWSPFRRQDEAFKVYDAVDEAARAIYGPSKFLDLVLS